MKRVTFCLVCGATSPVHAQRCQNCDAPLRPKTKRPQDKPQRLAITPLAVLVSLAVIATLVALVTWILLG